MSIREDLSRRNIPPSKPAQNIFSKNIQNQVIHFRNFSSLSVTKTDRRLNYNLLALKIDPFTYLAPPLLSNAFLLE